MKDGYRYRRLAGFLSAAALLIATGTVSATSTRPQQALQESIFDGLLDFPMPAGFERLFADEDRFSVGTRYYEKVINFGRGYALTRDIGWLSKIPAGITPVKDRLLDEPAQRYDWTSSQAEITIDGNMIPGRHRFWLFDNCLPGKREPFAIELYGDPVFAESEAARTLLETMSFKQRLVACSGRPTGSQEETAEPPQATAGQSRQAELTALPPAGRHPPPQGDAIMFGPLSLTLPEGWSRREDTPDSQPRYEATAAAAGKDAAILLAAEDPQPPGKAGTQGVDILSTRVATIAGRRATIETWHHAATGALGQTISFSDLVLGKVIRVIAWTPKLSWPAWKPELQAILAGIVITEGEALPPSDPTPQAITHPPVSSPRDDWRVWEFGAAALATPPALTPFSDQPPLTYAQAWDAVLLERPDAPESGLFLRLAWSADPSPYSADLDGGSILRTSPSQLGEVAATATEFRLIDKFNNTRGIDVVTDQTIHGGYLTITCRMPAKRWQKAGHVCAEIVNSFVIGQ